MNLQLMSYYCIGKHSLIYHGLSKGYPSAPSIGLLVVLVPVLAAVHGGDIAPGNGHRQRGTRVVPLQALLRHQKRCRRRRAENQGPSVHFLYLRRCRLQGRLWF